MREGDDVQGKKLLCVAVRPWEENDESFCEKMAHICKYAYEKWQLVTLFLPMKPQDDEKISRSILEKSGCEGYVVNGEYSVNEILGIVSLCDIVAAMRLHSLIYALGATVPCIGISYDPKVDGFLKYAGIDDVYSAKNLDEKAVCGAIDRNMQNREEIKSELCGKKKELCEKAKKNACLAKELLEK